MTGKVSAPCPVRASRLSFALTRHQELRLNPYHGPLGTLWVGFGLGCFYIALIWLNTLLGFVLTPFFIIPQTWLLDRMGALKGRRAAPAADTPATRA